MRQIVIQKKYIVAVETSQDVWRLFVIIVNYILNVSRKTGRVVSEIQKEVVSVLDVTERFLKEKLAMIGEMKNEMICGSQMLAREMESKIVEIKNIVSDSFIYFKNFLNKIENRFRKVFEFYFNNRKFVFVKVYSQNNFKLNNKKDFEIYRNLLAPPVK